MKNIFVLTFIIALGINSTKAQLSLNGHFYGEDALKFNTVKTFGSAKVQGMGGAYSALGADMTNAYLNPAGIAFYNKSEFSFSPTFYNQNSKANYIDLKTNSPTSSSSINVGQVGAVFSSRGSGTRKKRTAWGITYNTLANFSNDFNFGGTNNKSSITDFFAQKTTSQGYTSTELDSKDNFNQSTGLAQNRETLYYQSYLIDPEGKEFVSSEQSTPFKVNQDGRVRESGNLGQVNISGGVNFDDRTYIGGSIGIQNLSYNQITDFSEDFPTGKNLKSFNYNEDLFVSGNGVNINIGTIYKLTKDIQIGVNVVSPTFMKVKESVVTKISNALVKIDAGSKEFEKIPSYETVPNDFLYRITSPIKANFAGALFLPKKLGVINLEAEYVGYGMMNVSALKSDDTWSSSDKNVWSANQKSDIQNEFKDVINFKAGSELRFGNARIRGGINYYADPHKNSKAYNTGSTYVGSLGAGVRNSKYYADIAYSKTLDKYAYTPYVVLKPEDYASATISKNRGIFGITVGTYF
jgi:hypothetical protein